MNIFPDVRPVKEDPELFKVSTFDVINTRLSDALVDTPSKNKHTRSLKYRNKKFELKLGFGEGKSITAVLVAGDLFVSGRKAVLVTEDNLDSVGDKMRRLFGFPDRDSDKDQLKAKQFFQRHMRADGQLTILGGVLEPLSDKMKRHYKDLGFDVLIYDSSKLTVEILSDV